ncbi:MAG: hypothetical protein AAB356_03925 [Deltaproteobacteria bacterium]
MSRKTRIDTSEKIIIIYVHTPEYRHGEPPMTLQLAFFILGAAFACAVAMLAFIIFLGGPSLRKRFEDLNQ